MAVDTVTADPGSGGASFLVDAVSTYKIATTKLVIGADDVNDGFVSSANPLPVTAATLPLPSGAATAAKQPALGTAGTASADVITVQGIASGTALTVSAASLPLPSGASTSALQTTGNTSLSSIDGKLPALSGGSVPVVATQGGTWTVGISASQTIAVTNAGTFAVQATIAAGATNIAKAEDAASADADVGVPALAVRKATPANTSGTDGDYEFLQMSAGRLWTSAVIDTALPAGTNAIGKLAANSGVTIGAVEIAAAQTLATVTTVSTVTTCSTLTTLTGGGVAHDGVDSGNPVKVGARAVSSLASATLVAAADRSDLVTDLDGALIVKLNRPGGDLLSERVSDTGGTSTAFSNFGAVASTRNVITAFSIHNSSATAGYVDFRDGTGGAVLWTVPIPAGGGAVLASANGLFRTSANTALAYDVSAALTTVYISVSGFQTKA